MGAISFNIATTRIGADGVMFVNLVGDGHNLRYRLKGFATEVGIKTGDKNIDTKIVDKFENARKNVSMFIFLTKELTFVNKNSFETALIFGFESDGAVVDIGESEKNVARVGDGNGTGIFASVGSKGILGIASIGSVIENEKVLAIYFFSPLIAFNKLNKF